MMRISVFFSLSGRTQYSSAAFPAIHLKIIFDVVVSESYRFFSKSAPDQPEDG